MKEKKQSTRKLPGKVIAAVTFNDLASNCMWMLINYYLLFFYTDVLLIPASAATVIFTIARIWDVINDPMMGVNSQQRGEIPLLAEARRYSGRHLSGIGVPMPQLGNASKDYLGRCNLYSTGHGADGYWRSLSGINHYNYPGTQRTGSTRSISSGSQYAGKCTDPRSDLAICS